MGPEVMNKNKDSIFNGPYAGRDMYITMLQDKEREFVVTHNANIKPVSYFTGRETELKELRQRVEEKRKSVLVSGMGGIGKTHLCRKMFEEYLINHVEGENNPFQYIGYVEYNGDMGNSLQKCLKYKQQAEQEYNQEAVWRELEYLASNGKLLLFVDNVDKSMEEDDGLQRLSAIPGAIILTSRRVSFSDEFEPYRVGYLSTEQCREIYEKIRFDNGERKVKQEEIQDLDIIVEKLAGRHTITVEFLAHLARTKLWPVKRLRDELEGKGFQLEFHKNGELINIQQSYEMLYDLSNLTAEEQNILEAFSVFPYIPLHVEVCNKWLLADAGVNEEDDVLIGLYQKGWLQFELEQECYAMHPVFAQFISNKYKPKVEKHMELIKECQDSLMIPKSGSAMECSKIIPFAENIIEKFNIYESMEYIGLMASLAYLLAYIAEYGKAEKIYERVVAIWENILGEEHLSTADSYNNLAIIYKSQGEYEKARELYEKSMGIRERVLGEEHPDTAVSYNNLAGVYKSQGEYEKARELYEKSLRIRERVLGEEHLDTARSYNNLAGVYKSQREYKKARELCEKSLKIRERVLGEEHPDTAVSYNNLAIMYESQGEYERARELYEKSLKIRERVLGEEHPDTARSYDNLAGVYKSQGEYEKARELYEKSMGIQERVLGEEHPDTAVSYNNLAGVYKSQGEYEKARELYEKSMANLKRVLGEGHPDTAISYSNLAAVCARQGKYEMSRV